MQSRYTIHILPSEWRWVTLAAIALVSLAFAPFLWVALSNTQEWQFMGALHNYKDGASYIAKMLQGQNGQWLLHFQHTPEPHNGAFIQVIYLLLGHLSRLTSLPTIVMFHVARVGASLFMYIALYQLAASIWQRVRTRRLFFLIVSLGAGFGWLLAGPLGDASFPDLTVPEAFPLAGTYFNVHFPLAIACLSLLMAMLIALCRPGAEQDIQQDKGISIAALLSLAVALLYPQGLVPLVLAAGGYLVWMWVSKRRFMRYVFRWIMAVILPAVPLAIYYMAVVTNIPAFAEWNAQNRTEAPNLIVLLLGLGLPLIVALPALVRAVRRFEQEDDRVMLLWLVAMLVCIYLPTNVQRRFALGLMIPVAYFATRGIEDFWLRHINRRMQPLTLALFLPIVSVSLMLILFLPVLPVVTGNPSMSVGIFLERDYTYAFQWLERRTAPNVVVLGAPVVGTWLPAWAGTRTVYGHDYETLDATEKYNQSVAWYQLPAGEDCAVLLDQYHVEYVILGPEERDLGEAACIETLEPVYQYGSVNIYAP